MKANPGSAAARSFATQLNHTDEDPNDQADAPSQRDCWRPLRHAVDRNAGQHAENHSVRKIGGLRLGGLFDHSVIIAANSGGFHATLIHSC